MLSSSWNTSKLLLATLSVLLLTSDSTVVMVEAADQTETFTCGDYNSAQELPFTTSSFSSIGPYDARLETCQLFGSQDDFLQPQRIHWHVYSIAPGQAPRFSSYPDNLVTPQVKNERLKFKLNKDYLKDDLGYRKGDDIEVAVNLFVPIESMESIVVKAINGRVQVQISPEHLLNLDNDRTSYNIKLRDEGIDNKIYVTAPDVAIDYEATGINSRAQIEAGGNSQVDLSGVDNEVTIKTPNDLEVDISGVSQRVLVEGTVDSITMSGVDSRVQVNGPGGCNNVDRDGVDVKCSTTDERVVVEDLKCLADTSIGKNMCDDVNVLGMSSGGVVGLSIAGGIIVLLIVLCCICGCLYGVAWCCCWPCRRSSRNNHSNGSPSPAVAILPLKISPPRSDDSKDSSAATEASQPLPRQEPPSDDTTVIVDPAEVIVEPEIMVDVEDPAEFYPSKDSVNAQIY